MGTKSAGALKQTPKLQHIPIVFVTAINDTAEKVKAFEIGGVDHITKPFQFQEILARVKTHINVRRLQKELEERCRQLEALERLKDDLTNMVIHDLRSPLQAIRSYIELVLMSTSTLEEIHREDLERAFASAGILNDMVTDLLDVTRMEQDRMPLNKTYCDLRELGRCAAETLGGLALDCHFSYLPGQQPVRVQCDQRLVRRVITNLLANAFKFAPRGAEVTLRVSVPDGKPMVEVADTGPGIPDAYHERIFEKFGQVETQGERAQYSTGLGLTFCKMAIEAHDGKIGLRSGVGKGSTFWFSLPAAPLDVAEPPPSDPQVLQEEPPNSL